MNEELMDVTTVLERMRDDLVTAIAADQRRSRGRRRVRVVGVVLAATLFGGTALAAATGVFSPAPDPVKQIFGELGEGVDPSRAVEIGVIDEHPAYAAPSEDGSFCLYFAPNAGDVQRSGPAGSLCIQDPVQSGQIALAPLFGHDGAFVFGRVEPETATTVQIQLPGGDSVQTEVATDGFFLVEFPQSVLNLIMPDGALDLDQLDSMGATATDADGTVVANARAPYEKSVVPGAEPTPTPAPSS
jgi:hypothetical protein